MNMNVWRVGQLAQRKSARRGGGFTLVEIIVVVIIIGLLATLVAPRLLSRLTQSRQTTALAKAATLSTAVEGYLADGNPRPSSGSLRFLLEKPSGAGDAWKQYVKNEDDLKDPWGMEFQILIPGKKNKADYDIVSYGADKKEGGEGEDADIVK